MHTRSLSLRVALLALFALVVQLLIAVAPSTSVANATTDWPKPLSVLRSQLLSHPDGSVTAGQCSGSSSTVNMLQSFSSNGTELGSVAYATSPKIYACIGDNTFATGKGGRVFVLEQHDSSNSYRQDLVSYVNGVKEWPAYPLPNPSSCLHGMTHRFTVGTNGDPYVLSHGCSIVILLSLDAATGAEKFSYTIGGKVGNVYSPLQAYSQGLVYHSRSDYESTLRFFDYNGVEDTNKAKSLSVGYTEHSSLWAVNPSGRVFVNVDKVEYNKPAPCTQTQTSDRVIRVNVDGTMSTYDTSAICTQPGNDQMLVTPDGGALFRGMSGSTGGRLVFLSDDGTVSDKLLESPSHHGNIVYHDNLFVDLVGNIVLAKSFTQNDDGDNDHHVEFLLLNGHGEKMARYSTESFKTPNRDNFWMSRHAMTLSAGSIYAVICHIGSDCPSSTPPNLHKIDFVEVDYDYPRAELLGAQASSPEPLNYVALGDSFSSGEGVEPFYEATDISPDSSSDPDVVNMCHKSKRAYAEILDSNPQLNLTLQNFAACSGAVTQNITTTGQWNEDKQINAITADTDIVTVTIGGNDVHFRTFIENCLTPGTGGCSEGSSGYNSTMYAIEMHLPQLLADTYTAIASKLHSDARVYAIGYPYVVKEVGSSCSVWDQLGTDEQRAAEKITLRLNQVISTAVSDFGNNNYEFVDPLVATSPFEGHHLCSGDPYFHDYSNPEVYTAHPNSIGQAAYAELVMTHLN